mgnify:CR=1 FL=1
MLKKMPGRVAQIEWEEDAQGRVTDLVVFDFTTATEAERDRYRRQFSNSHGACVADWMAGGRSRPTPEGLFVEFARDGFAGDEAMLHVLDQLGQIEEAGWARTMAQALRELKIQEGGGEPEIRERFAPAEYE